VTEQVGRLGADAVVVDRSLLGDLHRLFGNGPPLRARRGDRSNRRVRDLLGNRERLRARLVRDIHIGSRSSGSDIDVTIVR
jgi:hypothetical protein